MKKETDIFTETLHPYLSIVIPVYRSESCLQALIAAIKDATVQADLGYEVILVNDCSPDGSWNVIQSICSSNSNVIGVDLRRNFGQDNAIMTGLRMSRGMFVAIMDDDLQHHPKFLPAMVAEIERTGADVVYAVYQMRYQKLWKNVGSWINSKIAEWVIYKPKDVYLSPYKVIRREVTDLMCGYCGPKPYIDGLLFQFTSRITQLPIEHYARFDGESTYTFWRSVATSARLAFSFSVRPLRLVSYLGFVLAFLGLLLAFLVVIHRLYFPEDFTTATAGWASLMVTFLILSGGQMVFFGVLGEYAGRTYLSVNRIPQTSIRQTLNEGRFASRKPEERDLEVSVAARSSI